MTTEPRLDRREWTVQPVSQRTCEQLVWLHHYARSASNTAAYRHGLFRLSDPYRCVGVAQWIPPTRDAAIASWDGDWHEVLALSRLVLAPEVPANGASYLIGQSVKLIRAAGRWRCLVTYADMWQGHTGAIYRATNWEYLGLTKPEARWLDPATGMLVSKYAGGVSRSRAEMAALGYQHVGDYRTHKYRLLLPPTRRRDLFGQVQP
jgi:hypothetical protein